MTAYALHFRPREVLIAADTLSYTARGQPFGFYDKVVPLPRLRAAFFGRGADVIAVNAIGSLALRLDLSTFDDVAEALPAVLAEVTDQVATANEIDDHESILLFEGYLVGWSEAEQKMRACQYNNYDQYRKIEHAIGNGWTANPPLKPEFVPKVAGLSIERTAIEIMKAQQRCFSLPVGGEILFTRITPEGVGTRSIHRFADYEQHQVAAAAVRGRVARGELTFDYQTDLGQVALADGPRAGQATTSPGAGRAERRRAEKLARKAGRRAA